MNWRSELLGLCFVVVDAVVDVVVVVVLVVDVARDLLEAEADSQG